MTQPCDPLLGTIFYTIRKRYRAVERTIVTHFCDPGTRNRLFKRGFLRVFRVLGRAGAGSGNRTRIISLEG